MKVYCSYSKDLDRFIKKVVKRILNDNAQQLNLVSLEEIELLNKSEFTYLSDAKTLEGGKIVLSSRLFELLPTYNLKLLKNNNDYKMLVGTLYHEMIHISDMKLLPNLYKCVIDNNNLTRFLVALFWIEYLTEKMSCGYIDVDYSEACTEFSKSNWECNMSDLYSNYNQSNFFYLTKYIPYFMARTRDYSKRKIYLNMMNNDLLKDYIEALGMELELLESIERFDDVSLLKNLYTIMNKYYKKFMNEYG